MVTTPTRSQTFASVREAANIIDVSTQTVRRMLQDGRLRGKRLKADTGRWMIYRSSIETLLSDEEGGAA